MMSFGLAFCVIFIKYSLFLKIYLSLTPLPVFFLFQFFLGAREIYNLHIGQDDQLKLFRPFILINWP